MSILNHWDEHGGNIITVRVFPKASANRIKPEIMPDGSLRVRVYVTVAAEGGKANETVIKLLAKALELPKSSLNIVRGELSQNKIIKITK